MLYFRGPASDARIAQGVRDTLMAEPEILPKAMEELERKQLAAAVGPRRAQFEAPYAGAWAGAADGDVVLVEFFDYACGFCRKSNADVDRLLAEDPRLKVVWRELPVLGADSQAASEVSLAAAKQNQFRPFFDRLFAQGRPVPEAVAAVQQQLGVRSEPGSADVQAELEQNFQLARAINASGTPTFVIGDKVLQGAVGYDALKEAIAQARAQS
jgi:protein-disulfide isomerase